MNEILELQTGQVSFISGLMAGFSLTIAAQVIRSNAKGPVANTTFVLFVASSLLFLIALYIDVALSLRVAGISEFPEALVAQITMVRNIGTSAATSALFIFIASIGLIGWLQSKWSGIVTGAIAIVTLIVIWMARSTIFEMG